VRNSEDALRDGGGERRFSRLRFLRDAGAVGLVAATAGAIPGVASAGANTAEADNETALESLSASQAATVNAVVARFIPTDANGPGATEGRVGVYIDRALGGALSFYKQTYDNGLDQVDDYAQRRFGATFVDLPGTQQDAILTSMQTGKAAGFEPDGGSSFFALLLQHSSQGMFGDPHWGGNYNFAGWDLIGYPGVKLFDIAPSEQALDTTLKPQHKSGYSFSLFTKTSKKETRLHPLSTSGTNDRKEGAGS
jgi:gluconate 2-dehydrogenase gamma chain